MARSTCPCMAAPIRAAALRAIFETALVDILTRAERGGSMRHNSMVNVPSWWCHSSAPSPPQRAPVGSGLAARRAQGEGSGHMASSHCLDRATASLERAASRVADFAAFGPPDARHVLVCAQASESMDHRVHGPKEPQVLAESSRGKCWQKEAARLAPDVRAPIASTGLRNLRPTRLEASDKSHASGQACGRGVSDT